jgi:hypothetical protein
VKINFLFFILVAFFSLSTFAKTPIDFDQDIQELREVQQALLESGCRMDISVNKKNAFIRISKPGKDDSMNFHEVITSKSLKVKNDREVTTYETNWHPSGVLFADINYRTRIVITRDLGVITKVSMKSLDKGMTIYFPVLRHTSLTCFIK